MANTVILKWNPAISSFSLLNFLDEIINDDAGGDWSVHDYDQVRAGDIFYMLKVGRGQTGIVMRGTITSDPAAGGDWSGQGRTVYYCDYEADIMINPDTFPLLTSQDLQAAIPGFDWSGGHSGQVLDPKQADKLEKMWRTYLQNSKDEFKARLELIERRDMWNDQLYLAPEMEATLFGKQDTP